MSQNYIENWYVPPIDGMRVGLNPESSNYETYKTRQTSGSDGVVTNLDVRSSDLAKWRPDHFNNEYIFTVKWDNGHTNDYTINDLIPIHVQKEQKVDLPKVKLTDGSYIVKDENFLKNLAIAVIEKGLSRANEDGAPQFDLNAMRELIGHNIMHVENLIVNNAHEDFQVDMLNALYDARDLYEGIGQPATASTEEEHSNESVELPF